MRIGFGAGRPGCQSQSVAPWLKVSEEDAVMVKIGMMSPAFGKAKVKLGMMSPAFGKAKVKLGMMSPAFGKAKVKLGMMAPTF